MLVHSVYVAEMDPLLSMLGLLIFISSASPTKNRGDPEIYMNTTQLITSKGYPCENHYVTTADGFILNMQRIPHGVKGSVGERLQANKPVVLLQHGIMATSSSYILNLANDSLATILADTGADVWLGNARGNRYSRAHKTLKPNDYKFWKWSWDEMARYDLPAMIDYIVQTSGQPKIYYVGHSQGTMIGFAGFSQNKTLGHLVKTFIALAPVAKLGNIKTPLYRLLAPFAHSMINLLFPIEHGAFMTNQESSVWLAKHVCVDYPLVCELYNSALSGVNFDGYNTSRAAVYLAHGTEGTSTRNVDHVSQGVLDNKFQMFDHGSPSINMQHYNQSTPPAYNVSGMKVPVVLFSGGNDFLADPEDVAWLRSQLTTIVGDHVMKDWEHLDFIINLKAPKMCYDEIKRIVFG